MLSEMTQNKPGDIALKTGGRRLRVKVKPKDREPGIMTHEKMDRVHSKVTKRDKGSKLLGQGLRKVYGRGAVQPYYREYKQEKKKKAESFLEIIDMKLKDRDDTKIACVIKNSTDFIEHMKLQRKVRDAHKRVGLDGGQNSVKVTVNVMDKEEKPPSQASSDLFEGDFKDTGRFSYYFIAYFYVL